MNNFNSIKKNIIKNLNNYANSIITSNKPHLYILVDDENILVGDNLGPDGLKFIKQVLINKIDYIINNRRDTPPNDFKPRLIFKTKIQEKYENMKKE